MKLTYLSHSCFMLDTGKHRVLIDPYLTDNPKAPLKLDQIQCDFILVSHGHSDHLGDAVPIAKRTKATIISTFELVAHCQRQGAQGHGMNVGGAHDFPFGKLKTTIAHHSSSLETDDGFLYLGNPVGFIITAQGKTVYHAGDTALFLDMQLIGQLHRIDVALLPIGDNFTMGIDDAARAVEFLKPKVVIPMHYDTFDVIKADPQRFARQAAASGAKVEVLSIGASFEF
jgi:L-ascorbate metabolism protein UlaG (beta-lactamase superfamily)